MNLHSNMVIFKLDNNTKLKREYIKFTFQYGDIQIELEKYQKLCVIIYIPIW